MKKPIGFELKIPEDSKIVFIKLDDDTQKYIKDQLGKTYIEYLEEFIGGKENYEIAEKELKEAMHNSLSSSVKENCLFCNDKSDDECDKACNIFYMQMQMTYAIGAGEFIRIVMINPYILNDKVALQQLTINFFNSLNFIKDEGKMYLDLEKLCRYALNANFDVVEKMFKESETFKNLELINDVINELDKEDLENKIHQTVDENYLELQKLFFEQKQKYYKEKYFLEKEKPPIPKGKRSKDKISIPKVVLYYYYLQVDGKFPYFENHPQGKVIAIEELLIKDKIKTTQKHFQLKYNFISHYNSNRIAKNQIANIDYVANEMLNNYPEAKELALSELKLAQLKNR